MDSYCPSAPALDDQVVDEAFSDSFLALNLNVVPDAKDAQQKRDEALARILQQTEQRELEQTLEQERKDSSLALQLLLEEKTEMAKEQERKEKEEKRVEGARKQEMLDRDFQLAKALAEADRVQEASLRPTYQPEPAMTTALNSARQHALHFHNQNCGCAVVATYNNNHIYQTHDQYCRKQNCVTRQYFGGNYNARSRQGPHQHGARCCTINHIHTLSCYCVTRAGHW